MSNYNAGNTSMEGSIDADEPQPPNALTLDGAMYRTISMAPAMTGTTITPAELAQRFNLKRQIVNGQIEWHGPNPFESGATEDGFWIRSNGTAYDRKIERSYTSREVAELADLHPNEYEPYARWRESSGGTNGHIPGPLALVGDEPDAPRKQPLATPDLPPAPFHWSRATLHDYHDESGTLLFQVGRCDAPGHKKTFRQRQPNHCGGWIENVKGVHLVPYCFPEVLKASTVYICEGEKAADRLNDELRLAGTFGSEVATTNPQGATKWHDEYSAALVGKAVCVLPDADDKGRAHAIKVCGSVAPLAASVRLVEIPGLPEKGDAFDFFAAAGTLEQLRDLCAAAPLWAPKSEKQTVSTSPPIFAPTDTGNAERFAAQHSPNVRYCPQWGRWLVWDGCRWKDDAKGEVAQRVKATVRSIYGEASATENDAARKELATWARKSESRSRRVDMLALAQSEPGIPIAPNELDADPWLFNVQNGTLDLRTGELRPHQPGDLLTKLAPVVYDPHATCPRWLSFLDAITNGRPHLVEFLKRAVGYSLSGDTREQVLFILHGIGANGKSTMIELLLQLLGDYALQTDSDLLLAKSQTGGVPNDVARLRGARFVAASETEDGRRLAESRIKSLTGGDTITARFLHQEFFEFRMAGKIWLATNHRPTIRGTDHAIWRRVRLVPFDVTFDGDRRDTTLSTKLRSELPGILNWAIEGALSWQRSGLTTPTEVQAATNQYRQEMDVFGAFLNDCCVVAANCEVTSKTFYGAYQQWCKDNGEHELTQTRVGKIMRERGFESARGRDSYSIWRGVGLKAV